MHPLTVVEEAESTNTFAREHAARGAPHGTVIVARRQTAGRGRRGRTWTMLPGPQLAMTLILRPSWPMDEVPRVTLAAAVALAEALERFGLSPRIKWPNDVELDGKKVAGILSELVTGDQGELQAVLVGIGVNLTGGIDEIPVEIRQRATTVALASGLVLTPDELLPVLLQTFDDALKYLDSKQFPILLEEWRKRSSTLGQPVRVTLDQQVIEGLATEVDDDGALLVTLPDGRSERVVAGEVQSLRKRSEAQQ